jgi:uncharacterized coiled-coil protein SlyX
MKAAHYLANYVDQLDAKYEALAERLEDREETIAAHRRTLEISSKKIRDLEEMLKASQQEVAQLDKLLALAS